MPPLRNAARAVGFAALLAVALPTPSATATTPTVTLSFVGDTILGNTPTLPSQPSNYLSPVVSDLRNGADIVFGNLEGTLTTATSGKCGGRSTSTCFQYRNPPSFAKVFAGAGYTVLNGANNHSYDFGAAGRRSTATAIHDAHMVYTGMPGQITYLTRHGVRVAFVAFAPYSLTNNLLDLSKAASLIRTAHNHAGIVVVYMHAGAEGSSYSHVTGKEEYYVGEDRGNPRRFAHLAVDNGASIVVASGPHVMRGMEFYKRHLIAYSLGDFANHKNFSAAGALSRSGILHVTLTSTGTFQSGRLTSVALTRGGRAYPGGDSVSFVSALSRHDFGTAAARLSSAGTITR
jgi:poly-gamma-glutamate capsule biosynthesis protein CapA/YwtB (metallophosphatase superfamily)